MTGASETIPEPQPTAGRRRRWPIVAAILVFFAAASLIAVAGVVFQDNIARFAMNPRTPFQLTTTPPPPQYGARGAWAIWPQSNQRGRADTFYVHSTTYYARANWNAPLQNEEADRTLRTIAAPNEAGPFNEVGAVFGPRYRQATLYAFFTHKYDGVAARKRAFDDVALAFEEFMRQSDDPERPIILVGYGQGGLHVLGLLRTRFAEDETLRRRLAAAYVIDYAVAPEFFEDASQKLPACDGPTATRCIVAYVALEQGSDSEIDRVRRRTMVWSADGDLAPPSGRDPLCTNPLVGAPTLTYVGPAEHKGAASATGLRFGQKPPAVRGAIGAQCDAGILKVDRPAQEFLRKRTFFGAKWKAQPFNLFYHDLAADAKTRVAINQELLTAEATILDPIDGAVDIAPSPINRVPE